MGGWIGRTDPSNLLDKEIYIAEGKGGKMTHSELRDMRMAVLNRDKPYNLKWAKVDEEITEKSSLWIDLVVEDHSKLLEMIGYYKLPNLNKITISNTYANKGIFQKFLLNSLPDKLNELHFTAHEFEIYELGSIYKLILQNPSIIIKWLHLGNFEFSSGQFKKIISKYAHLENITLQNCKINGLDKKFEFEK